MLESIPIALKNKILNEKQKLSNFSLEELIEQEKLMTQDKEKIIIHGKKK